MNGACTAAECTHRSSCLCYASPQFQERTFTVASQKGPNDLSGHTVSDSQAGLHAVREVLPGVVVVRSPSGSVSVVDHGRFAGWLHASSGNTWNAFIPTPFTHLGRFTMDAATRVIIAACRAGKAS